MIMIVLEGVFKIDTPLRPDGFFGKAARLVKIELPLIESPTPYIPPEPTPTPHPMDLFVGEDEEKEIVFPAGMSYTWLSDPYCFNGEIICSAGKLVNGKALMCALLKYNISTGKVSELPIKARNDHLIYPVFNEKYLVYFDANQKNGGGDICALDLKNSSAEPKIIKKVYVGQPEIKLWDEYIAWTERTGSERDKIFVCHIPTEETTVVQYFNSSGYGASMPYFENGKLIWAGEDSTRARCSSINYISLNETSIGELYPGVYVHDPETNGKYYAWLDGPHGPSAKLYVWDGSGTPVAAAEGVVEFGIAENFVAYGKDETVWIYVFENGKSYRLTPERENTQFLGVSGGYVMWMDVTSRERDIIKYALPPL